MIHNSVIQLRQQKLIQSTKPFKARGCRVKRCEHCLLPIPHCLCHTIVTTPAKSRFCLIMFDGEVYKPSNTGKLIADILPDTHAFSWSRTDPNPKLLALIQDPTYQPYIVFPEIYASAGRQVYQQPLTNDKIPLFILLDGTWTEARKMFRKSPYLDNFPLLSINTAAKADYLLRVPARKEQHCTAEVASRVLEQAGDLAASKQLLTHFKLFRQYYLAGKPDRHT